MALHAVSASTADPPSAERLVQMTSGLWVSQTLFAAECLGLFTFLSNQNGATVREVAHRLGIAARPAEILLTACAALELVERDGRRFINTPLAEEYLVRGRLYYFGDYIRMLQQFVYPAWMRITDAIRSDSPSRPSPQPQKGIFDAGNRPMLFWDGLHSLSALTARALAEAVDLSTTSRLLDVGGGDAAFDIELCRRYPGLRAIVYDLPHVCELAADRIRAAGMSGRIGVYPGDFFEQDLPPGHDTILLSMVLHDWDEPHNRELLVKCFRALPAGGMIVISELFVDDDKTGPLDAALMSMNMLVGTHGRNYTAREYSAWLRAAGFDDPRAVRFRAPGANGAVLARKP
jgi:hypothetical protein